MDTQAKPEDSTPHFDDPSPSATATLAPAAKQLATPTQDLRTFPTARQFDLASPIPFSMELRRQLLNTLPLVAADIAVACFAFLAAGALSGLVAGIASDASLQSARIVVLLPALLVSLAFTGVYPGIGLHPVVELRRISLGTTALMAALFASLVAQSHPVLEAVAFTLTAWCLLLAGLPLCRSLLRNRLARTSWWGEPIMVLGSGKSAQRVFDSLAKQQARGMRPLGIVSSTRDLWDTDTWNEDSPELDLHLGFVEELPEVVNSHHVRWAVIADPDPMEFANQQDWRECAAGIPHLLVEGDASAPSLWSDSRECGTRHAVHHSEHIAMRWPSLIKRAIDLSLIAVCSAGLLPLMAILAVCVKVSSPNGPVFYGQRRIGRGGRMFTAWKFRSMAVNSDELLEQALASDPDKQAEWDRDHKLKKDPRVIPVVGTFLRKTSLDELPQLWNVLRGEMSLVGPRPIVQAEVEKYDESFLNYRLVRPGITGLWQVSGRNDIGYDERVELDNYYVRNWSPWLDVYILARTVKTVAFREGAY